MQVVVIHVVVVARCVGVETGLLRRKSYFCWWFQVIVIFLVAVAGGCEVCWGVTRCWEVAARCVTVFAGA